MENIDKGVPWAEKVHTVALSLDILAVGLSVHSFSLKIEFFGSGLAKLYY
jgi:hypothetical protein